MRCNICYLPIHDQTTVENCPRCFNAYHKDHLAAWLLNNTHCPMCREELSEDFRDEFKPKDERDRQRLEDIMRSLDGLGDLLESTERRYRKRVLSAREAEFGIEKTPLTTYIKIAIPFIFLGLFILFLLAAIANS